jgi:predicted nucleotidyltransferase
MLKARILSTLRFFDLQEIPLTWLELHRFLLADGVSIKAHQNEQYEFVVGENVVNISASVEPAEILACIATECQTELAYVLGYYCLAGREDLCIRRWKNYAFSVFRERRINKFVPILKYFPFIRAVALGGSQALGQPRKFSDIDLFIVVKPGFLWLVRTMVSLYFQILGLRRHGRKIANRFCLNHYVVEKKIVDRERNLYKAMEYVRLRPLIYPQGVVEFLQVNAEWIKVFLPNWQSDLGIDQPSSLQRFFERCLNNILGRGLNNFLGFWQKLKIKQDEFTFVLPDELSFHPQSQHRELLNRFFSE